MASFLLCVELYVGHSNNSISPAGERDFHITKSHSNPETSLNVAQGKCGAKNWSITIENFQLIQV